jgi:hypothetical protein
MKMVTWLTRVYKKKAKFKSILNFNECKKIRRAKKNAWYLRRWILATHLGA